MIRPKLMFSSRVFGTDTEKIHVTPKPRATAEVEWYLNTFRLRTPQARRDAFPQPGPVSRPALHLPSAHGRNVELLMATPLSRKHPCATCSSTSSTWLLGCAQSEPQIITLHVGSNSIPVEELDWDTAPAPFGGAGRFAAERNGMVLLENLKVGWTTDPNTHLEMIQRAGLQGLTFDTGHAASNPKVRRGA